ncbi:MAG TPA: phosphate ABC transporter permease PstA [Acidimicrobiales bacterium]|nr:phosphate ABC transporter permease PstA [Acidimicrobiales bacterium]
MTMTQAPDRRHARREEIQKLASGSERRRKIYSGVGLSICGMFLVVALIPLISVLAYTVQRGVQAWSADFFSHLPTPAGIPGGGIWNAMVGSLIIDGIAAVVAVPFGIAAGLFLAESEGRVAGVIRFAADVLSGVPSIIIGIFAYIALVRSLGHFSAIAGSFAIGVLMVPIIIRASETAIRGVPHTLAEAGLSLGARRSTVARRVILPTALPGLITGVLLAVARGVGETAPLLFTAIGSQYFATNPNQPMAALPLVVFQDGIQAYPDLQQIAWGTALFLITVVLVLSVGSRLIAARLGRVRL